MVLRHGNLFVGISNEQLKQCYDSYIRIQVDKRRECEIFDDMTYRYKHLDTIENQDESKKDIASFVVAREHMFNEIARRYFKVCDGFRELFENSFK